MTAMIEDNQKVTPFMLNGCEIIAANAFSTISSPCMFQVCGKVWADGVYTADQLIEAGVNKEEIEVMKKNATEQWA